MAEYYRIEPALFATRGDGHIARAAAAWLARRLTTATLRELAGPLGLGRPESVSNLTRRIDRHLASKPQLHKQLAEIERRMVRIQKQGLTRMALPPAT